VGAGWRILHRILGMLRKSVAVLAFFGPMIFAPEANQGPMLGLFITGPAGVVIGAIAGAWYAMRS